MCCAYGLIVDRTNTLFIQHHCLYIFYHVPNFSSRTYFTHAIIPSKSVCVCMCVVRATVYVAQCHMKTYTLIRATVTTDANAKTKTVILKLNPWHFCRILYQMMFALQISKSARCKWSRTQNAKRIVMVSKINQWINNTHTRARWRERAHIFTFQIVSLWYLYADLHALVMVMLSQHIAHAFNRSFSIMLNAHADTFNGAIHSRRQSMWFQSFIL